MREAIKNSLPETDLRTADFYYNLPQELIAQHPMEKRDTSRLMVLDRATESITHRHFYDIIDYLREGDVLVINDSKVIPARVYGHVEGREEALIELLLLRQHELDTWECLVKPGKRARIGMKLVFGEGMLLGEVKDIVEEGNRLIHFTYNKEKYANIYDVLSIVGLMPLPPYIKEELQDQERYQTVYSREVGSAAAPTAGLHWTKELLQKAQDKGVQLAYVTLHVGLGTFRPVKAENISEHHMHSELCMMTKETADILNDTRKRGGRIVCVGTTSCRTLESLVKDDGTFEASSKWTEIFIYPGYTFKAMDGLITNFHLPESTLVMLVSAFAGRENVLHAYEEAVKERYRFFSFGDAMCIL